MRSAAADDGLWLYILKTAVAAIALAVVVSGLALWVSVHLAGSQPPRIVRDGQWWTWLMVVVVSPLGEYLPLYLACAFSYANFRNRPWTASLVIGCIAGLGHALVRPLWFFGPAASFFVWSYFWFSWRSAGRPRHQLILLVPHMIQNAAAMTLMSAA